MGFVRRNITTILVAMITAAVTAGGPAIAATIADYATRAGNADKVDGRHAVAASATASQRAGKLVATNSAGRLPNNIIAKAPDAQKLDGLDSTAFLPKTGTAADSQLLGGQTATDFLGAQDTAWDSDKLDGIDSLGFLRTGAKAADSDKLDGQDSTAFVKGSNHTKAAHDALNINAATLNGLNSSNFARNQAQPGETLTGGYVVFGTGQGFMGEYIMFPRQLPAVIPHDKAIFVQRLAPATDKCPGPGQAAAGFLCVYEIGEASRHPFGIFRPDENTGGTSRHGFAVWFNTTGAVGSSSWSYGSWTYQVPS